MTAIREPRTIEAATRLAERFAELEAGIGVADAVRNDAIAKANAAADEEIAPLIEERDAITAKVGSWWGKNGREQALGAKPKAKSIELGGCLIGDQKSRAGLQVPEDEDKLIERMKGSRALKKLLRVKVTLDKAAVLKELGGAKAGALKELGLSIVPSKDVFFIKRAEQGQTRS